jgi:predicted  nucleic acid-binding Zn-ribbon protein
MDTSASNYNSDATDGDNSCISWEEAYDSCVESGGDDGITQDDVDAVQNLLNVANLSLSYAENNILSLESELNTALANQEDGVSQADIDAIQTQLDAANTNVSSLNYVITNLESEISESNASIITLEAQIEEILANCGDDGVTQADVDAVQELLDLASISITDLQSELVYALANQEDGITQADVAAVQALLDQSIVDLNIALANQEDGIGQAEVDAAYADGASSVTPEDGVSQADVDAIQVLLDDALANTGGGSCEAIYVDLLSGWNIVGYTLTFSQDVAATLDPIVEDVQIVKDNSANVYWPEYGFNGIGDFIPGQGYQIRMHNEVSSYTFPDVDGLRIDLTETVPAYVYDLPILNHPNDIKSLVKVVNMLGQEVNPTNQFTGEVLLYLFNDGTTEKRIVE